MYATIAKHRMTYLGKEIILVDLLTAHQVAEALGVTHAYVRQMIQRGIAKPQRLGKFHVFTQAELDRLRNRRTRGNGKKVIAK
jgi:hypothetical protein